VERSPRRDSKQWFIDGSGPLFSAPNQYYAGHGCDLNHDGTDDFVAVSPTGRILFSFGQDGNKTEAIRPRALRGSRTLRIACGNFDGAAGDEIAVISRKLSQRTASPGASRSRLLVLNPFKSRPLLIAAASSRSKLLFAEAHSDRTREDLVVIAPSKVRGKLEASLYSLEQSKVIVSKLTREIPPVLNPVLVDLDTGEPTSMIIYIHAATGKLEHLFLKSNEPPQLLGEAEGRPFGVGCPGRAK
jgi:hypothetical protein